ncbi:MAP/microtubule affinity-regulating kinase 3-like isoform X1 [Vespula squamosa]|uniref:MAP/microtubule affinity-regulating kinase 3-like isoform X1 n=1 Tax=Vespula squamosa TaxID=30214 RepID=A0ABD2AFF9_VESSQ
MASESKRVRGSKGSVRLMYYHHLKEEEEEEENQRWRTVARRLTAPEELVSCIWRRAPQIIWGGCQAYLKLDAQPSKMRVLLMTYSKNNFESLKEHYIYVAVKIIDTQHGRQDYVMKNLTREAKLLSMLQHPSIVRLYETIQHRLLESNTICFNTNYGEIDYTDRDRR